MRAKWRNRIPLPGAEPTPQCPRRFWSRASRMIFSARHARPRRHKDSALQCFAIASNIRGTQASPAAMYSAESSKILNVDDSTAISIALRKGVTSSWAPAKMKAGEIPAIHHFFKILLHRSVADQKKSRVVARALHGAAA